MAKPFVFLSYCQKDHTYRDELVEEVLGPCKQAGLLDFWYDQALEPGDAHETVIMENLGRADVVICLVSPRFVGSWFIQTHELPAILAAHKAGTKRVIWLLLRPLDLGLVKDLAAIQAGQNPSSPLSGLDEHGRGLVYQAMTKQLRKWAESQAGQTAPGGETVPVPAVAPTNRARPAEAIALVDGDLAQQHADVVVVSASATFQAHGGIEHAIHQGAGPGLQAALRVALAGAPKLGVGKALSTPGCDLPARMLVHAVAPHWRGEPSNDLALLHRTYDAAFDAALVQGARTIALGSFGTGQKGFPPEVAAAVAVEAAQRALARGPAGLAIRFVLQDPVVRQAFEDELAAAQHLAPALG